MKEVDIDKKTIVAERNVPLLCKHLVNIPLSISLFLSYILSRPSVFDYFNQFNKPYIILMKNSGLNTLISENINMGLLYLAFAVLNIASIISFSLKKPVIILHVSNSLNKTLKITGIRVLHIAFGLSLIFSYYFSIHTEPTCTVGCFSALFKSYKNNYLMHEVFFLTSQLSLFIIILPFFIFPLFCRK